jgi:hypothetical protein
VWRETASGAKTDRAQLRRVLDQVDAGDVLMVTRLDRLARSTRDLLNILATIAEKKAGFRSLGDTWADTTTSHGRLMLTVLGGLAEFDRAYRRDVAHFLRTLGIATPAELRQVDHKAVIAWERFMRESEHAAPSTIRRRLAALSSLFKHLVRHGEAARNPVAEIERPAINRDERNDLGVCQGAGAQNAGRPGRGYGRRVA